MLIRAKVLAVFLAIAIFGTGWLVRSRGRPAAQFSAGARPRFHFDDVSGTMGIDGRRRDPVLDTKIQKQMRLIYRGSGVVIADFNGDGWMDIFIPNAEHGVRGGGRNWLYLNQKGRGFKEVAEEWGVASLRHSGAIVSATAFDYDNDGKPDLYLAGMGCSKLYHNLGNGFEDVTAKSGIGDCKNSYGAIPLDYNNDGKLDLYILRYWPEVDYFNISDPHPRLWTENMVTSRNGGKNSMFRNGGDGTFKDVTAEAGGADTGWSLDGAVADFEGDGVQRLYVADDFGADTLWKIENEKLAADQDRFDAPDRRWGMDVSIGDLDHDGLPHIHVSNEGTTYYDPSRGNFLWKLRPGKPMQDEAYERKTNYCGGWSFGAVFGDFDLDGQEDLYVLSGMMTGKPKHPDYRFVMTTAATLPGVVLDLPDWPSTIDRQLVGNKVGCMFWNHGSSFEDVAKEVGLGDSMDGRAVATLDIDNNGSLDLAVTAQKSFKGETAVRPERQIHLYRNSIAPGNNWVGFSLVGTKSNRDGVGARMEIRQAGQPMQFRWATGGKSGLMAISDPRLHFGLPLAKPFDATIRWPSGLTETISNVVPGRYYVLVEGKGTLK